MSRKLIFPESPLKSKRLALGHETNHVSWAFERFLRMHAASAKVYDLNPYIQVFQLRENLYGLYADNIDGQDDMWMYLLIGPEKAMLIDTGYGIGDFKGLLDLLTGGKPLIVVNTHEHPDHSYGNCCFDRVYCHETLVPYLELQDETIFDYLFDKEGNFKWVTFDKNDLPTFKKYEIVGVPEGYCFNLGEDYDVEIIHVGGHASGQAVFLDKKGRNLFVGDTFCSDITQLNSLNTQNKPYHSHNDRTLDPDPHGDLRSASYLRGRIAYLVSRMDEFDHLFPGHYITDLESDLLEDMLRAMDSLLEDPEHNYTFIKELPNGNKVYRKYIEGFSMISYRP